MILLFWLKRENDFTILVGREYDFTVEVDSSSGAKKMLKVEPYLVLSRNERESCRYDTFLPEWITICLIKRGV